MRAKIQLNKAERQMILTAMRAFKLRLKGAELELFNIAFNRIKEMRSNKVCLDGMENIYVVRALKRRAKLLWAVNKRTESNFYRELANEIETVRMMFQYNNHPVKKENAESAPTQTA